MLKMSDRFIPNPFTAGAPFGPDEAAKVLRFAGAALKEVKSKASQHKDVSGGSIYVGSGGVALTYLHLAKQVQRGGRFSDHPYLQKHKLEHCLDLASQFCRDAESISPSKKRVTFLEGYSGLMALEVVLYCMTGQQAESAKRVKELEGYYDEAVSAVLGADEYELLYGLGGYLYSLLWVDQQLGVGTVSRRVVKEVVSKLLDEGRTGAAKLAVENAGSSSSSSISKFGLMYSWHGKHYLGAAHGLVGILYVLLHCLPLLQELDPSGAAYRAVRSSLDALVAVTFPSGNLPSSLGSASDKLVQWCHGAPGLIPLLLKAEATMGANGAYLAAARRAADVVVQRGLLKKGVGLCHGISGNGYALLSLYRATRERTYLSHAQQFALYIAQHWQDLYDTPDRPASLYEGLAGAVCFCLDVLRPETSSWPGYEL